MSQVSSVPLLAALISGAFLVIVAIQTIGYVFKTFFWPSKPDRLHIQIGNENFTVKLKNMDSHDSYEISRAIQAIEKNDKRLST
jgi:hypothetical protein